MNKLSLPRESVEIRYKNAEAWVRCDLLQMGSSCFNDGDLVAR